MLLALFLGCRTSTDVPSDGVGSGTVTDGAVESAVSTANETTSSPEKIREFFARRGKKVLTFTGYSSSGYEDRDRMLEAARNVLADVDPETTIVNIGATPDGIGAVYELANSMGFETTGIVSVQAKKYDAAVSPYVNQVFFIQDETWGGFLEGTDRLSPTSQAMVESTDVFVSIGGGEVSRDELIAAKRLGKVVTFIPADMNHEKATEKAKKKGLPVPTGFRGAAHEVFGE